MAWIIENTTEKDYETNDSLYWSNEFGWVVCGYDVYSDEERHLSLYDLPLYGEWVNII